MNCILQRTDHSGIIYMNLNDKFPDKSPQTASRLIDGEAVIVVPEHDEVKVLNEAGSRIWDLLDGTKDVVQLSKVISDEFDVSLDNAVDDMNEFIDELYEKNMIVLLEKPKDNSQ